MTAPRRRAEENPARIWWIAIAILSVMTILAIAYFTYRFGLLRAQMQYVLDMQELREEAQMALWEGDWETALGALELHEARAQEQEDRAALRLNRSLQTELYESTGDYERAEEFAAEYLRLSEQETGAARGAYLLGWLNFLQGDTEEALQIYRPLIEKQQQNWESGARDVPYQAEVMALVLAEAGEVDAAQEHLRAALAQMERVPPTVINQESGVRETLLVFLAEMQRRSGDLEEAEAALLEVDRDAEWMQRNIPLRALRGIVEGLILRDQKNPDAGKVLAQAHALLEEFEQYHLARFEVLDAQTRGMAREAALEQRRVAERVMGVRD